MCGIAGILSFDDRPIDTGRVERMLRHMRNRGPDGEGIVHLPRCSLAHTRLSIIDHKHGAQPMTAPAVGSADDAGALTVVFNGEIYNHRDLRRRLERFGHTFKTDHCDTEVLLHGYRQWGEQLPKHLNGMFAFAIHDHAARSTFLCRDRLGQKPLYLRWGWEHGRPAELMFASLVGTLVTGWPDKASPGIDAGAMQAFLRVGYAQRGSMITGVEELPAGHWLTVDDAGRPHCEPYWRSPPVSRTGTSRGVREAVRELLEDAVATRLEADVELGAFLSGGIDSSLLAALAQERLREQGASPLRTFSVRMGDSDYDESPFATQVARHIGSRHTELKAEPSDDVVNDLRLLLAESGEPTADSSILPTYWLSQVTREHVKVALSGDGGDELFAGYDRYRAMRVLGRHGWWLSKAPADWLDDANPRSLTARARRLLAASGQRRAADQYLSMIHLFTDAQIEAMGVDLPAADVRDAMLPPHDGWTNDLEPAQAAARWDLNHYLPFDLLRKVDRASMAVGLEVRCPMLDHQVVDLAAHLPLSVLMPRGRPKAVLRDLAADLLPAAIARRPKRGFAIPIGRWFRGPLQGALRDCVIGGRMRDLGFDRFAVEQMIEDHTSGGADHTHRLFALLMLALWVEWLRDSHTR